MAWPFCTGFGKWVVPGWVAKSTQDTQDSAGWLKHGLRFGRSSHLASWRFVPPLCWTNLVADFSSLNSLFRGSWLKMLIKSGRKPWSSKPQSVGNPFQVQSHAPPNKPRQPLSNLFHSKAQTLHELSTRKAVLAFCFSHCLTGPAAKVVANSQTGHWSPKETQIHNHSNKSVPDPHLITPFALYTLIHHKPP